MSRRGRRYKWNLFGWHCGLNVIGRLKWINGLPMVYVTLLNVYLFSVDKLLIRMEVPGADVLFAHWGWHIFDVFGKIVFIFLFTDGVATRFLFTFTRGRYNCSYFIRRFKFPEENYREIIRDDIALAWFRFRHCEFDYRLQKIEKDYFVRNNSLGERIYAENCQREVMDLMDEFRVCKDEKGKYFSWDDRKYRKILEKM